AANEISLLGYVLEQDLRQYLRDNFASPKNSDRKNTPDSIRVSAAAEGTDVVLILKNESGKTLSNVLVASEFHNSLRAAKHQVELQARNDASMGIAAILLGADPKLI